MKQKITEKWNAGGYFFMIGVNGNPTIKFFLCILK